MKATIEHKNDGIHVFIPWQAILGPGLAQVATERGFESLQPLSTEAEEVKSVTLSKEILTLVEKLQERWQAAQEAPTRHNLDAVLAARDELYTTEAGCEVWRSITEPSQK